jgi:alkylation response protein AidB-like acyl-CoA dehydrogenase
MRFSRLAEDSIRRGDDCFATPHARFLLQPTDGANAMDMALDAIDTDAPLLDPDAFGIGEEEAALNTLARRMGSELFAPRAAANDREARFPAENYRDLRLAGLLGLCVPSANGGLGVGYRAYCTTAAEIGRYCAATALTWNMHTATCLWSGALCDDLAMSVEERRAHERRRAIHYRHVIDDGALYAQPFSEGGHYDGSTGAAPLTTTARRVPGGWRIDGRKIFASLSGAAQYYGILCVEPKDGMAQTRREAMFLAVPAGADGVEVTGDWDPLGMRATVSRTVVFKDVFVDDDAALMPPGAFFQSVQRWPHMLLTLTPTYLGLAQAAFDFTVRYLRGEIGEAGSDKRRSPAKQHAVAEMFIVLQQMKTLWFQAVSEAHVDPSPEQVLRALAAQYTVMEQANTLAQLALRTCGGRALFRSLPLERIARDARCGAVMLPWTAEACLERLGHDSLYRPGEDAAQTSSR